MRPALALAGALLAAQALALDPPHDASSSVSCTACHVPHSAPGAAITTAAGAANLCLSCHVAGGMAAADALADADQALPAPGLPPGAIPGGRSHRWDSGPAGHVEADSPYPGVAIPSGAFTGRRAKTYALALTAGPTLSWTDTLGGSGSSPFAAGTALALDEGVSVAFSAFVDGARFSLYVRPDLAPPLSPPLAAEAPGGATTCPTCHDEHSQAAPPFPDEVPVPAYLGAGTGAGRHFQRIAAAQDEPCRDCHRARDVASSALGSHPVGVPVPAGAFRPPTALPLDAAANVRCSTCHDVHRPASADGALLRIADPRAACTECHTLADTATPAAHLDPLDASTRWPGGALVPDPWIDSTYPPVPDPSRQGACANCHSPHGWPEGSPPGAADYPTLLVQRDEALCLTCHNGLTLPSGAALQEQVADFFPTLWVNAGVGASANTRLDNHHDVTAADQATSGARVGCVACHDPHRATRSAPLIADPDRGDGRVPAPGQTWAGSDLRSEWCLDCHDGSLPASVVPPTVALANVRTTWVSADKHGTATTSTEALKPGGWTGVDVVPCTACHDPHGTSSLFHLRTTMYAPDGVTVVPPDTGCTSIAVTSLTSTDRNVNGWCFCNTCHTGSMSGRTTNCFSCHYHGKGF